MTNQALTPVLPLTAPETARLRALCTSRSVSIGRARRAAMLLEYCNEVPVREIARTFRMAREEVERYIDKALQNEVLKPRDDARSKSAARVITDEMVAWVHEVAGQDPRELGYERAQWSTSLLAEYIRKNCRARGHHALADLKYGEVSQLMPGYGQDLIGDSTWQFGESGGSYANPPAQPVTTNVALAPTAGR